MSSSSLLIMISSSSTLFESISSLDSKCCPGTSYSSWRKDYSLLDLISKGTSFGLITNSVSSSFLNERGSFFGDAFIY
jgi:hypothetical protein